MIFLLQVLWKNTLYGTQSGQSFSMYVTISDDLNLTRNLASTTANQTCVSFSLSSVLFSFEFLWKWGYILENV